MREEHAELLLEYLYWIGYSLDTIAARAQHGMPANADPTILPAEPDPPPQPTTFAERMAMVEKNSRQWRPA